MKDGVLAENHSEPIIRTKEPRKFSSDVMPEVRLPIGYKIEKDGVTLEIRKYVKSKAICYCSVCGPLVPALKSYTTQNFSNWLDFHISIFRSEHTVNKN